MKTRRVPILFFLAFAMFWVFSEYEKRSMTRLQGVEHRSARAMEMPEDGSRIIHEATALIDEFASAAGKDVLSTVLGNAVAVAVVPAITAAGFTGAGNRGTGVLLVRRMDRWTMPVFVTVLSGSLGNQIGSTSTDFLLIFRNPETISQLEKEGSINLGEGRAALGPIGASADLSFIEGAEVVAYKRTEGEFIGFYIRGGVLSLGQEMTLAYYVDPQQGPRGYYGQETEKTTDDLLRMDGPSISEGMPEENARKLQLTLDWLTHRNRTR